MSNKLMYDSPTNLQELFSIGMDRALPEFQYRIGRSINLGAGKKFIEIAKSYDLPVWDADKQVIPEMDNSVAVIHMYHFLEHVADPINLLRDCQRVLIKGGICNIVVPYYNSQLAAQDLDHKHQFTEGTWKNLFENPYYDKNGNWQFKVKLNIIMGLVERNLSLFTQLVKI